MTFSLSTRSSDSAPLVVCPLEATILWRNLVGVSSTSLLSADGFQPGVRGSSTTISRSSSAGAVTS